jgi:hypothetical protein
MWATTTVYAAGIAIGSDGTVYLANGHDGLRAFTYNGSALINLAHIDDGGFAFDAEVGPDGNDFSRNGEDGLRAYTI